MFIPLDSSLIISLLEGHSSCFDPKDKIFVEAPCASCGFPTIPEVNANKPFIGSTVNYLLKCTQCGEKTHPISLNKVT